MTCCDHCVDAGSLFDEKTARRELRRYRKKGPTGTTRHLVQMLETEALAGADLLDIGGGIGALQLELLRRGVARAQHVDASAAYLGLSKAEASNRGLVERVEYMYGDFVDLAPEIPEADIVTMDRVVCCYPDMPRLVEASTSKARRLYGLSYPRAHLGTRVGLFAANLWFRVQRSHFRTYLHPPPHIDAEISRRGFQRIAHARTLVWEVALYRREDGR